MANLNKYINEVADLLSKLRVRYESVSASRFDNFLELVKHNANFEHFETAIEDEDNFTEILGGYNMARIEPYIFIYKRMNNYLLYIEVELV